MLVHDIKVLHSLLTSPISCLLTEISVVWLHDLLAIASDVH